MSKTVQAILLVLIGGLMIIGLARAQFSALDPVRVAPHIYENVLENDRLRVLKVTERSGETAPLHSHPERLVVHLSPCAWLEETRDGESQMQSYKLGDTVWAAPVTHGGKTSQVVQECSRLEIEMKGGTN